MLAACGTAAPATTTTAPVAQAACPSDLATLIGTSCSVEGATCGHGSDTGLSNIVVCRTGTWRQVEVPPPPPTTGP